jgi:disulfide bond formation protein DsbB
MTTVTGTRLLNAIALLCVGAVAVALVSQHVFDMLPCAWCVLQRLVFLMIAVVCWLAVLAGRYAGWAQRLGAAAAAVLGCAGVVAAWYQYTVAANKFSCDMTFADRYMVSSGLDAGIPWLFGIFATCMDAKVSLLGIEYALWGLGLFVLVTVLAGLAAWRGPRH